MFKPKSNFYLICFFFLKPFKKNLSSIFSLACGYLKHPESAFLNWKQFHADQPIEGGLLFLSNEEPELIDSQGKLIWAVFQKKVFL